MKETSICHDPDTMQRVYDIGRRKAEAIAATGKDCRVAIREWIGWAIKITSASRLNPAGYAAVRFRAGNRLLGGERLWYN